MDRQTDIRLWAPRMCCDSKLETPRLKFTAHAQCMTLVSFVRSVAIVPASSPKLGRLRSDGKQTTFDVSMGGKSLADKVDSTRSVAEVGDEARTRQ